MLLIKINGKKVILSAHGGAAELFFEKYGLFIRPILKKVDIITTPSGFLSDIFKKAFGIKIPREELFPAESLMNDSGLVHNGKLTEKGLNELREKMPHTDLTEFETDPDINKMADLFTVNAIVNYIENKLSA